MLTEQELELLKIAVDRETTDSLADLMAIKLFSSLRARGVQYNEFLPFWERNFGKLPEEIDA